MKSYLRQIVLFKDGLINIVYPTHFPYSVIFERQDILSIPLSLGKAVATAETMLWHPKGHYKKYTYIVCALFSRDARNPATIFWGSQAAPWKDHVWVSQPPSHLRSQLEASIKHPHMSRWAFKWFQPQLLSHPHGCWVEQRWCFPWVLLKLQIRDKKKCH